MMALATLTFILINIVLVNALPDDGDLRFVTILYRHGDRTPTSTFPTDKYNESYWPLGWGQLTNLGKNQEFELGKWLREKYSEYLPLEYNEKDIYVEAEESSRTLMSAYANLAGLYEPTGGDIWREDIHWQPIPVRIMTDQIDYTEVEGRKCERYDQLLEEVLKSEAVVNESLKYTEVFKNLSVLSGIDISGTNFSGAAKVYSSFLIEEIHGFELPSWASDYYPQPLRDIKTFDRLLETYNLPMKKLQRGALVQKILNEFDRKINGSIRQKMWHYSAHDTDVLGVLRCLDIFDGQLPSYACVLIFELYEQEGRHFVQISYRTNGEFKVLKVPGCEALCPLETLKELVKPVIPGAWEDECRRQ